jgi:hypothetical protein
MQACVCINEKRIHLNNKKKQQQIQRIFMQNIKHKKKEQEVKTPLIYAY